LRFFLQIDTLFKVLLKNFKSIRPAYELSQEDSFSWFIDAHVKASGDESFRSSIEKKFWRVGCKPGPIAKRGHVLADFCHRNWDTMEVYNLNVAPGGKDLATRSLVFEKEVDRIFEEYYPEGVLSPDDLIHVSCTGYVSPSGAQKIVSKRNWGKNTTITHAYHMGCYASIPALRMGLGFLNSGKTQVDVVHTELCSLHSNPSLHSLDQIVSQSLFADGFMKYSLGFEADCPHIKVLSLKEEIIPNSTSAMTWKVLNWGFEMSLSAEVPTLIARHLNDFLKSLGVDNLSNALFAVHPGGPKILAHVQNELGLTDHQMSYSVEVLKEYGNMSSATLPHVWSRILDDEAVLNGTPIVSLAFGPGLSIVGALMEKRCGS
jgi:predicted naringenin-chalcone synthase